MGERQGWDWKAFAAGAVVAALALWALGSRYSVHTEAGAAYRLDRWTGALSACGGQACYSLRELKAQ